MNAVEHLPRLDDASRIAARDLHKGIAAWTIDACKAQDRDPNAAACAEILPGPLGRQALAAARHLAPRRCLFVHPRAGVIAINPDGRQIDDGAQVFGVPQCSAEGGQHRIAALGLRNRHKR